MQRLLFVAVVFVAIMSGAALAGQTAVFYSNDFEGGFYASVPADGGDNVSLKSGDGLFIKHPGPFAYRNSRIMSGSNCVPDGVIDRDIIFFNWGFPELAADDPNLLYLPDGYHKLFVSPEECGLSPHHSLNAFVGNDIVLNTAPKTGDAVTVVYPNSDPRWTDPQLPFHSNTVKSTDPAQAVPFLVWSEGPQPPNYQSSPTDILHFIINIGDYTESVDVYLGLSIPGLSNELFLFGEDGGLYAFSANGLVKFRNSARSVKTEVLTLTHETMSSISASFGKAYFYTMVTPAGRLDGYHLWVFESLM